MSTCSNQGCDSPVENPRWRQCESCRAYKRDKQREWRERQPDNGASYQREFNRRRRLTVLEHYGGKCECCGEDRFEFLAIDHRDGGGSKHRSEVVGGGGSYMVAWIINNDFPDMFRVLCHNCNLALGFYGRCPHEALVAVGA